MALAPVAPTLAPPPAPPASDLPPAPTDRIDKDAAAEIASAKLLGPKLKANQEAEQQQLGQEERAWNDVPRPEFKPPPQPTVKSTDPKTVWASSAMVMAAIGSLFTRTPLTTAMNAAAKVMDAFHEGDQAAANAAFQTWKISNDNYVKAFTIQNDAYNQVRAHIGDLEQMTMKQHEAAASDAKAQVDALTHAFNDDALRQQQTWEAQVRLLDLRQNMFLRQAEAADKVQSTFLIDSTMKDWHDKFVQDNGREPNHEETLDQFGKVRTQFNHEWTPQQEDTQVQRFKSTAPKTLVGAAYNAGKTNMPAIMQYDPARPPDTKTGIQQVALLDNYIKTLNGNRAMRGFQFSILQKDEGLINSLKIRLQQIGGSGPLSKDMAEEIQKVSSDLMHVATLNYGDYITSQQWGQWKAGIDPSRFTPDEWMPAHDDPEYGAHPEPNPKQIDYLRQNPSRDNWLQFDDLFGQGAAAQVFSQFTDEH